MNYVESFDGRALAGSDLRDGGRWSVQGGSLRARSFRRFELTLEVRTHSPPDAVALAAECRSGETLGGRAGRRNGSRGDFRVRPL